MNNKISGKEIEDNSSDDEEQNDAAFADIQPSFKKLVQLTKFQLYECIVKGPPITSKQAQDNTLLLEYLAKLNIIYQLCEDLNTGASSSSNVKRSLSMFPLQTQEIVKQLLDWLTGFFNNNQYVDTIPYSDYLEVQLRRYPFLQKIM